MQRVSVLADDAWGGFAVLTAEMCRPEVIVLVCKGSGGELNQALIINYYLLFIIYYYYIIIILNEIICLANPVDLRIP